KLQTVFDLFVQLNVSKDRSEAGLGIGLTLVQRLIAQHGGRVQARSEGVGRGSEFVVTLPRVPVVAAPSATLLPPSPALRRLRILLIEDNADARDMLKMGLELTGHRVDVAVDGAQGIQRAVTACPGSTASPPRESYAPSWDRISGSLRSPATVSPRTVVARRRPASTFTSPSPPQSTTSSPLSRRDGRRRRSCRHLSGKSAIAPGRL